MVLELVKIYPNMRFQILFFLFLACVSNGQDLVSGGILKPEQAIMDIRHYRIVLDVDPATQSINGYTEIEFINLETTTKLLFDLVHLLTVEAVWLNNQPVTFVHRDDLIYINLDSPLPKGRSTIKIAYGGQPGIAPRPPWDGGFTWSKDINGNPWVAISCQGEGIKIYVPCKDHPSDEPNEGAELIITVPEGLIVAGPGLLKEVKTKRKKSTFHWETDYTINNYSMLFNVGKFEIVSREYITCEGNTVPMQFYVLEENVDKAEHHLDILERCMRLEEKYFGEYPWPKEKIAICETPHLGMEHQTMNAYGNEYKYQQVGGKDLDWLMLHELGHEWWGNKVTGVDFSDMWIQEGICVFGDVLYIEDHGGRDAYLKRMQQIARNTQNKWPIKMGDNLGSDTTYHSDIYGKGAFFMHTLRYVLGDEVFFPALKKLATLPEYTYDNFVSTDDVEAFFSKESGQNLKPFFDFYLRTTKRLDIQVKQVNETTYQMELLNYEGTLPIDIETDKGRERLMINRTGIEIKSTTSPIVDPDVYYLKRVIQEW